MEYRQVCNAESVRASKSLHITVARVEFLDVVSGVSYLPQWVEGEE
jgi:hypothetical protein